MTGNIKKVTANYSLRIPYFDTPGWGREMERDLDIIDAVLFAATNLSTIVGVWTNSTLYNAADRVVDGADNTIWRANTTHTSDATGTFAATRVAHPSLWTAVTNSFNYTGAWVTGTQYNINDITYQGYLWAIVKTNYTSGASLAADIAASHASVLVDGTAIVTDATAAKDTAVSSASTASSAATAASGSASTASAAASSASTSASTASGAATTATTQAGNASTSATAAAASATAASGSATTASTQAGISTTNAAATAADKTACDASAALMGTCQLSGMIEMPQAGETYNILLRARQAGTITRTTMIATSGTATCTFKIDGTNIGQGAHSVSTAETSIARTSSNTFSAGQDIAINFTAIGAAFQVAWSMEFSETP